MTGISRHFELDLLNSHSEPPFGFPVHLLSKLLDVHYSRRKLGRGNFCKTSGTVPIDRENNCQ